MVLIAEYRTMTEIASQRIREAIIQGKYHPGMRLMPNKLEKELNLGRVPIREALRELAGSGLVMIQPNQGYVVSDCPSMEEIREIFEIRFLLEPKAAEIAAENFSDDLLHELQGYYEKMCDEKTTPDEYFVYNREFHLAIYRASQWHHLCHIIAHLFDLVRRFRIRYPFRPSYFHLANKDHEEILRAIRQRKPKEVGQLILVNIRKGYESFAHALEKRGE